MTSRLLGAVLLLVLTTPSLVVAGYDAAADFSATSNPTGVWSYGEEATLGGSLSLYTANASGAGIDYWNGSGGVGLNSPPFVLHNGTNQAISIGSIIVQAGQLAFHPGQQDQYSIIRFTSPVAGTFSLVSSFTGIDIGGTTTDVHVLLDGSSLFGGSVNGYGGTTAFNSSITLHVGDIIDFAVGYGSNGTYNNDSTALSAVLTPTTVPEPASIFLLFVGLSAVCYRATHGKSAVGRAPPAIPEVLVPYWIQWWAVPALREPSGSVTSFAADRSSPT